MFLECTLWLNDVHNVSHSQMSPLNFGIGTGASFLSSTSASLESVLHSISA